jgi:hypothetical protein
MAKITIDVDAKFISAIGSALEKCMGQSITDEQVANFIAMDLNQRYEEVHDNIGFDDEVSMMLDELEDFFI